jgi:hypothetical protein
MCGVLPVDGDEGVQALDALLQGEEVEVGEVRLGELGGVLGGGEGTQEVRVVCG